MADLLPGMNTQLRRPTSKASIVETRRFYRQQRRALSPEQQVKAARQLVKHCQQQPQFQSAHKVALYLANDGELDPHPLIEHCWQANKDVYLPVLHPFCAGYLVFVHYGPETLMQANRFGIPEPKVECHRLCPIEQLDILFTPLVAFDTKGNRLGMGGGFYDRTLKPVYQRPKPTLIGLAHDCQQADSLPVQPWDIPLQKILTPTQEFNL
ncbi:5-formyltetrahydrofolate cyclo-ligase [Saliniradius amylolyticus]|uniref:5-formyltetrahydrofolate cyclo-ligase n=1 Tax=Saliniradius amylolyticus TaxID=2183582 RepID=A0A2S2E0H9_9ALTE|nr:5-formyltetrahydrofolate cyclo-ligase [Saliniradius amylolyticus]AWL11126.1 5-formyltetrahydrofolate cyclo-ligase [Saliniradius amylolyticus]